MSSHERVSIIEVMGRNCGDLALYTGLCGGAEVIIVPEHKLTIDQIVKTLGGGMEHGKTSGIIVLAEGAGHADELTEAPVAVDPGCAVGVGVVVLAHEYA